MNPSAVPTIDPCRSRLRRYQACLALVVCASTAWAQGTVARPAESAPVAQPMEFQRETRRSSQESPHSALDARTAFLAAQAIAAHIVGAKVFTVLPTGSMRPLFDQKAFVVVEPTRYEDLAIGDIVTYLHPKLQTPVVHRIIEKRADGYWTKGDNSPRPDNVYLTEANYLMRVCAIVYAREDGNVVRTGASPAQAARLN